MGYYDIDDILADSAEIPCKFNHDIPGLGYLENNPGGAIHVNSQVKLPLWLARVLAIIDVAPEVDPISGVTSEENSAFLTLMTPEAFSTKVINAIKTDPVALDLHSINPQFYSLAIKWIGLFSDQDLAEIVSELLLKRAQVVNSHANSITISYNNDSINQNNSKSLNNQTVFTLTLDEFEKKIYKQANESYKDIKRWMFQS